METPSADTPSTVHETADPNATPLEEPVSLRQLLARASRVYDITIAAALEEAEMDDLPMRGISVLRRINDGEAGTPLAQVLRGGRISRQHGTQLIDTLVERGYIVRETDPEDRRRMRVSLTERGTAAAEAVRAAIDGLNAALAERVSPEQMDATRAVLSTLVELAPEGAGPERGWGGPERGVFPGGHERGGRGRGRGRGHRPDRGPGRGPRGPMRDFDPRFGPSGPERMRAFAARFADAEDGDPAEHPVATATATDGHDRGEDRAARRGGHPCGPRGRHGHCGREGERGHPTGGAPTIVHHVDTMIVNAGAASEGRGSRRHSHHRGPGGYPSAPWRARTSSPEALQPQPDTPTHE